MRALFLCIVLSSALAAQASYALQRGAQAAPAVEVYAEGKELRAAVERLASLARASGAREVRLARADAASGGGDPRLPRIVLGTATDPLARALAERLGAVFQGRGFSFLGREYALPGDALIATFEDPERAGLPLSLYVGVTPEGLADFVHDLELRSTSAFSTWRRGELEREGTLALRAAASRDARAGQYEAQLSTDRQERRRARIESDRRVELRGFRIEGPARIDEERVSAYAAAASRVRHQVLEWAAADPSAAPPELRIVAHDTPAEMRALLERVDLSIDRHAARTVHVLLAPGLPDDGGAGVARETARAVLGEPALPWLLDAVGGLHAEQHWGRKGTEWLAWLHDAGLALPIAELVDPTAAQRYSPHRLRPQRGMLLGKLLAGRGAPYVRALWRGEGAAELAGDAALQSACDALLAESREQHSANIAARRSTARALREQWPALRGFVATGIGVQSARYGETACADDVRRARELGANAFVFPFACWDRRADPAAPGQPEETWPFSDATDLEIAIELERASGSVRWLAPQLLSSPNAGLAGEEVRTRPEQWDAYFDLSGRVLEHYALLAELLGADGLFLGFELAQSTREPVGTRDLENALAVRELRHARWRELARAVRRSTSAALAYGARYDGETAEFPVWDELDAVGELLFEPLATTRGVDPDTTRDELVVGLSTQLAELAAHARKVGKPAFALAGCPARERGWERRGARVGPVAQDAQRLWYDALARALAQLGPSDRPSGVFLWALEPGSEPGRFDPLGTPSEAFLPDVLRSR
ncbi:MAG: hypothetical protein EPO68_16375 [Planctomycetota bacterium]|nr:MAG: hypothetical protein EPO68_16375 [Planctomycetota bacterium]